MNEIIETALKIKMYMFGPYDQDQFEFEDILKERGINYRQTSQTGSDITFYLEGHAKF